MVRITRLLTTFCLSILALGTAAQVSFDSKEELEKAANNFFEEGKYDNAKPLFSQLLSKDALDPNYNYRFGVCILLTEEDPLKPLPYIEGGANSAGVNKEALYYLGKAYQFNYRFEDAVAAYQKAKTAGFSNVNVDLDKSIQECLNGKVLYNPAVDFKPAQNKEVLASEFYRPYDFRKLKGKVIPMPPNFKTKYDEKNLLGTVVYTPSNSNILVYASYGEDGSNAKDLYRVNRLPNGEWALPQRLPETINTKYDEDYAFYDKDSQTLYFASKGHNTMGGYDVFSSVYDSDANSWSVPTNLQYPINSPFDDFLYIGDPNGKMAFFTTGRNTAEGKLRVIKTLLHDPKEVELSVVEGTFTDLTDSIYNYMSVSVLDPISNQVIGKYRSHKETGKYVLILPPQNDYMMDIGPREAEGFKFELDVPTHEPTKPLSQSIAYTAETDKGTITLTNYFDATGEPDSIATAESRPLQEVEDKMVAMPDPAIILAARSKAKLEAEAEEAAAVAEVLAAEAKEKAEKEAAETRVLAEKEAAEQVLLNAEQARKDSLAEVELALEVEAAAQLAEQKRILEAKRVAELAEQVSLAEAKQEEEAQAQRNEEALRLLASKEAFKRDSAAKAEQTLFAQTTRQQAVEDSMLAVDRSLALAEKERLDQINREVEAAKEKALRDSAEHVIAEQNEIAVSQEEAFEDILKEMEEKEAELLQEQALATESLKIELDEKVIESPSKSELTQNTVVEIIEKESAEIEPEITMEITKEAVEDEVRVDETISESELFLQTIARIEAQKAQQEKLIEEENKQLADSKLELAEARIEEVAESTTVKGEAKPTTDSTELNPEQQTVQETLGIENEIVALKSDADPEEYLAALNEIEAQMAKEAETRPDKDYKLKPLGDNQKNTKGEVRDPVLQKAIDSDRLALEQHQKIASEKEKALRDEMQKEKTILDKYDQSLNEELAAIENEVDMLEKELEAPSEAIEPAVVEEVQLSENEVIIEKSSEEEMILESIEEELAAIEASETEAVVEKVAVTEEVEKTEDEVVVDTESDRIIEAKEIIEEVVSELDEAPTFIVDGEEASEEEIVSMVDTSEIAKSEEESPEEKLLIDILAEAEEEWMEPVVEETLTVDENPELMTKPAERMVTVGTIPFLTAAIRNPDKSKPSFSGIEDISLRRMVKRMRAEDVGRLAVIKNIKNERIDATGDEKAMADIEKNLRNQDVLANAAANSREEYVRPAFDKDHLKERQDVYYKLEFRIKTSNVSETILESMTPEMEMTFAMPEFKLKSEFYRTFADVNSGYREYTGRGFTDVVIIPYLKGEQTTLSTVQEIPFID